VPDYSVYSTDENGLVPFAQMIRNLGLKPVAITRPVQQMWHEEGPHRLLFMVEPKGATGTEGETDLAEADAAGVVRWVEAGNTLVLVGRHSNRVYSDLDIALAGDLRPEAMRTEREVTAEEGGAYTRGVEKVAIEGRDTVQGPGLPLWWVEDRPGALMLRRGQGRVIVLPDPSMLADRGLRRADNAYFLYNVMALHARDGRVYFDEYHHGLHSGGGFWGYLAFHGLQWILLPILLTAVIGAWAVGIRLGPAVPVVSGRQADAVDYASALARIYHRAGTRALLARNLARDFLAAVGRPLGFRRAVVPAELLATWKRRNPGDLSTARLEDLLRTLGELRQTNVTERVLLAWTRGADQFIRETTVTKPKTGRK
jgi:hypothetical protein